MPLTQLVPLLSEMIVCCMVADVFAAWAIASAPPKWLPAMVLRVTFH